MNYVGILQALAVVPWPISVITLWFFTDGMIHLLRDKLEGLGYQTAWSAKYGDAALITAVMIAIMILQHGAYVPLWLQIGWLQLVIYLVCLALGITVSWTTNGVRSGQAADIYHDIIIAPAILFLAITLLPIIWFNALPWEVLVVVIAAAIWAVLFYVDVKEKRMNQRQWLVNHGFAIKGEIPKR